MSELGRRLARIEARRAPPRDALIVLGHKQTEADALTEMYGAPAAPRGVRVTFVEIVRFSERDAA